MSYSLLYLESPPNQYAKLSDHPTVQHALDWMNSHLSGGFVRFKNTSMKDSPEHFIRPSQLALMDSKCKQIPIKYESGVVSQQEEV